MQNNVEAARAWRRLQRNVISVVLAGAVVVALAGRLLRSSPAESPANATASGRYEARAEIPAVRALSSASGKLVRAPRDVQANNIGASSAGDEPPGETTEPTAEDYVRQVEAEPVDPNWAPTTTRIIEQDLRDKGEALGFTTRQVICRTASCFAEVDFPSQRQARESFKRMFGPPDRLNCPLRFLYPNDGNDSAHALGFLIIDCRDKRAREALGSTKG